MELGPKEIQETSKEGMRRKREDAVDMSREQNALTRSRLRLRFPPGSRVASWTISPNSAISSKSSCRSEDQIQSPWIQPDGSPERDEDPRFIFLFFTAPVAFFARSSAAILSFPMAAEQRRREWMGWAKWRRERKKKGNEHARCECLGFAAFKGLLPSG